MKFQRHKSNQTPGLQSPEGAQYTARFIYRKRFFAKTTWEIVALLESLVYIRLESFNETPDETTVKSS